MSMQLTHSRLCMIRWEERSSRVLLQSFRIFDESAGQDTDTGTYDALGRRFYAGVRVKF